MKSYADVFTPLLRRREPDYYPSKSSHALKVGAVAAVALFALIFAMQQSVPEFLTKARTSSIIAGEEARPVGGKPFDFFEVCSVPSLWR